MTDDYTTANFRVDLGQRTGQAVNVVEIVVGPTGFVGAPEETIVDYIRSAFADRPKPDLIVTLAGPAAAFARKYRQQLFPDVPLLLASVNQQYLRDAPLGDNETAVAVASDFPGVIDLILELLPQTKQVFVVVGSGQSGTFWSRELQTRFMRFQDRLTFIWSGGLSLTEILRQCASLPRDSAILYLSLGTDGRGGAYADARVLADLHAAANAPIFGLHSVMLGSGIVGGKLIDIDDVTRNTADAAIRILAGAPPRSVIVPPQTPGHPVFDWRELQRWGIPESRLPAGSVVRYRDPSLWQQHRGTVLSAVGVLGLQSLLIVGLVYQRRARRRAEIESRSSEAELRESEERLLLAAEAAHLGIWIRDLTRNDIWATDSWRALFGFAKSERLDLDGILRRLHPDDRETVQCTLARALEGDGRYEMELSRGAARWPDTLDCLSRPRPVQRRRHPHPRARRIARRDGAQEDGTGGATLAAGGRARRPRVDDGPARVRTGARDQSAARRDPAQCRGGGAVHAECIAGPRRGSGESCRHRQERPACGRRDRPDAGAAQAARARGHSTGCGRRHRRRRDAHARGCRVTTREAGRGHCGRSAARAWRPRASSTSAAQPRSQRHGCPQRARTRKIGASR